MTFPKLSWNEVKRQRFSIILALAGVVLLLVTHFLWIAPVASENEELEGRIKQQNELVHKYREKLNQAQSIKENLVKQESELKAMQKRLFQGNDPYQLAAALGDLFSPKGEGKKKLLDIKTYQVLASKEFGLYQEVHLRFNFMTTIEGLYYFLERLRNFETAILIQEINIQKVQRKGGPDLVINVILAGLMEKGEKT
jgi:DNA repair exonuclease SbcCD ATPase subunit